MKHYFIVGRVMTPGTDVVKWVNLKFPARDAQEAYIFLRGLSAGLEDGNGRTFELEALTTKASRGIDYVEVTL